MPRSPNRGRRINESLREVIAETIQRELSDPRLSLVTITQVKATEDMSEAQVFWTVYDRTAKDGAAKALDVHFGNFRIMNPFKPDRRRRRYGRRRVALLRRRLHAAGDGHDSEDHPQGRERHHPSGSFPEKNRSTKTLAFPGTVMQDFCNVQECHFKNLGIASARSY